MCIFVQSHLMVLIVDKKKYNKSKIDKQIKELKPAKVFDAKKFAGKILWEEDPLVYQKRLRNEWNQDNL